MSEKNSEVSKIYGSIVVTVNQHRCASVTIVDCPPRFQMTVENGRGFVDVSVCNVELSYITGFRLCPNYHFYRPHTYSFPYSFYLSHLDLQHREGSGCGGWVKV